MESSVLNYWKFEMIAPAAKCFLRRFVRAAQGINEKIAKRKSGASDNYRFRSYIRCELINFRV